MSAPYALSPADLAFQSALKTAKTSFESVPDGEALVDKIEVKFRSIFDSPFLDEFQDLVSTDIGLEEARLMLFKPETKDVPLLVKLFKDVRFGAAVSSAAGQTQSALQVRLKATLLTLIYLVHRKNWNFLRDFICHGGLVELTYLLLEENLYLRGQVVEILLACIDCDTFDWFIFKDLDTEAAFLHQSLLLAIKQPHFLVFLCMNQSSYKTNYGKEIEEFVGDSHGLGSRIFKTKCETFPGGGMLSLQIFGFTLSWVRALSFNNQYMKSSKTSSAAGGGASSSAATAIDEEQVYTPLHLHIYLFEQLKNWLDASKPDDITIEDIVNNTMSEEKRNSPEYFECKLAKTILDDFTSNSSVAHEETIHELIIGLNSMSIDASSDSKDSKENTSSSSKGGGGEEGDSNSSSAKVGGGVRPAKGSGVRFKVTLETITSTKEAANKYYNENKFSDALDEYNEAIDMLERFKSDDDSLFEEKEDARLKRVELECSLHYNKATVFWKMYKLDASSEKGLEALRSCEVSCRKSLEVNNQYEKSLYRLVNVLYIVKNFKECIAIIETVLARSLKTVSPTESSKNSTQAFRNFLYKCKAAEIIRLDFDILKGDLTTATCSFPTTKDSSEEGSSGTLLASTPTTVQAHSQQQATASSGGVVPASLVNPDALKVLRALQKRQVRENQRINHAYYIDNPNNHVVETIGPSLSTSSASSSSSASSFGQVPHEIDLQTSNSVGDIFDIMKSVEDKDKEAAAKTSKKKAEKAASADSKDKDKDKDKEKEKEKEKSGVSSKKAAEYLLKLADGSKEYSKYYSSRCKAAVDKDALSAKTLDVVRSVWKRDAQLKDVIGSSLSEYLVVLILNLVLYLSRRQAGDKSSDMESAKKVYRELLACQRFDAVVSMAAMTSVDETDVGYDIQESVKTINTIL